MKRWPYWIGLMGTLQWAPGHSLDLTTIQKKGPVQLEVLILTWDKIFKIDFVESVKFSHESVRGGSTFIKSERPETCCVKSIWYLGTCPAGHKLSATHNHRNPILIYTDATNGYTDATMGLRNALTGYAYAFLYLINTLKGYWDVPTAVTCTTDFFHYIPYGC